MTPQKRRLEFQILEEEVVYFGGLSIELVGAWLEIKIIWFLEQRMLKNFGIKMLEQSLPGVEIVQNDSKGKMPGQFVNLSKYVVGG